MVLTKLAVNFSKVIGLNRKDNLQTNVTYLINGYGVLSGKTFYVPNNHRTITASTA